MRVSLTFSQMQGLDDITAVCLLFTDDKLHLEVHYAHKACAAFFIILWTMILYSAMHTAETINFTLCEHQGKISFLLNAPN